MKFAARIIFLYIFILGIAFTFLPPPLQKPDEHGHFKRAAYLRRGFVFLWNDGKKLPLDRQFFELITNKHLNSIPYHPEQKFDVRLYNKPLFSPASSFEPVYIQEKAEFILGAFAYIPHAAGLLVARVLHLNEYASFFLGRLTMFIVSFVWMVALYRKTKSPYSLILLFAFSLPMVIHQLSSYGYDGMNFMMSFTLFAYFTSLLSKQKITNKQLFILGIIMFFFLISKVIYEPFILILFLIPPKKIDPRRNVYLKKIFILFFGIIFFYLIVKLPFYLSSLTYSQHPDGVNPAKQLAYMAQNPLRYARLFIESSWNLKKFHVQGAIGIFGWLDYSMNPLIYFVWLGGAILIVITQKIKESERLDQASVGILFTILFLVYSVIQTVFYLNWKPVGSALIDGTQGRYFISLIPFLLFAFMHGKYKKRFHFSRFLGNVLFFALVFIVLVSVVNSIQMRYY